MWEEPKKMDDPEVIHKAFTESGFDADRLLEQMQDPEIKAELISNTEEAVKRGTFGIPTFFCWRRNVFWERYTCGKLKKRFQNDQEHENILIEDPEDGIRRIVLNRPNKRNALSNSLRKELFSALEEADQDKQVKVIILSGAGKCFSAGYDLSSDVSADLPYHTGKTDGFWPRHVVEGAFKI